MGSLLYISIIYFKNLCFALTIQIKACKQMHQSTKSNICLQNVLED